MKVFQWTTGLLVSVLLTGLVAGCGPRKAAKAVADEAVAETYLTAVDRYLTDSVGCHYLAGEVCIPCYDYLVVDEGKADDILVWGDFSVFQYDQHGDTLKTVSGGNHPGLMHVKKDADGHFEVVSFEPVEDGAAWESSAKRIFGEKYDAFVEACSDNAKREEARKKAVSAYVTAHDLAVKRIQDEGWPAVDLD